MSKTIPASRHGPKPERSKNPQQAERAAAVLVLDHGKTYSEAAKACGVSSRQVVEKAVAREQGRREGTPAGPEKPSHEAMRL